MSKVLNKVESCFTICIRKTFWIYEVTCMLEGQQNIYLHNLNPYRVKFL